VNLQVKLLRYTDDPERTIAAAARISYTTKPVPELLKTMEQEKIAAFLTQLLSAGHVSPFEHASFTFFIDGISRVTSHQLVRHRVASYTQQSQRYVFHKGLEYVTPPSISSKPALKQKFDYFLSQAHDLYKQMVAEGISVEDARYVLPNAIITRLVMTMNARELMHSSSLRLCLKAQWEIVELFEKIKEEVKKVSPFLGNQLKPKCYDLTYCNEKESCGLFPVREFSSS
jgi:thymidylate synthase (FAD)